MPEKTIPPPTDHPPRPFPYGVEGQIDHPQSYMERYEDNLQHGQIDSNNVNPPPPATHKRHLARSPERLDTSSRNSDVYRRPGRLPRRGYDRGRKGTAILQGVQSVFDLLTQPLHADDRRDDRREDRRAQYGVAALQQTPARKELMRDLQHANEENKGLREHLMKLEETCSQLKRRNDAMQSTRDAQEEFLGRQEPDSEISARFEEIFSQVKNWTNKFCNTKDAARAMEIDLIDPGLTSQIQRVMPKVRSIQDLPDLLPLKDIKRRKKFIRGWIALNVSEHMFRSLTAPHAMETGSDLWIPEAARSAVMVLEMTLLHSGEAIPQFAFHEWRVLTFALLNKIFPLQNWQQDTDDAITKVMQVTMEVIRPLVSSNVPLPELEKTLRQNIYEPAIELSQLLRRQRACWYVRFPHIMAGNQLPENDYTAPYIFQPDTMKDIDGLEEDEDDNAGSGHCLKAIDIVILPGLYKSGNHDGKKYDIEYLLLKAEVSCTEIVHQNVREGMAYTQPRETLEGA